MYVAIVHLKPGGKCRAELRNNNHKRPNPPILTANGDTQAEAIANLKKHTEEALNTVERFVLSR